MSTTFVTGGACAAPPLPITVNANPFGAAIGAIDAEVRVDYYRGQLQFVTYGATDDEPAVSVRLTAEGGVAEIMVRKDLQHLVVGEDTLTQWLAAGEEMGRTGKFPEVLRVQLNTRGATSSHPVHVAHPSHT